MKVLLLNVDSTIPNLALKKCEKYHIDRGDSVEWNMPLAIYNVDQVYASCIFPENKFKCRIYENEKTLIGGSGYDLHAKLPPEIEAVKPRINFGFTTRGCIRKCYFCFVPTLEGSIRTVGDIYDLWDGKSKNLILMDNNILAVPDHFKVICSQIKREGLRVDFNQGFDHRLLTEQLWNEIKALKHLSQIRFAFDNIKNKNTVIGSLEIMKQSESGLKDYDTQWYLYISETDTFDSVYERLELLRSYKQLAFVMRDKKVYNVPMWIGLALWSHPEFCKVGLKTFLSYPQYRHKIKYFPTEFHPTFTFESVTTGSLFHVP